MSAEVETVEAPFAAPDVEWVKYSGDVPDGAIVCGSANGGPVYAGRVYIGNEIIIGTADLKTRKCVYCQGGVVREASDFEVMTVPVGDPLDWNKLDADEEISRRTLLKAGIQKNGHVYYVGRIRDGNSTYIGSVDLEKKLAYIAQGGVEKVSSEFEILIHKYLEFLCICPPCPADCMRESPPK